MSEIDFTVAADKGPYEVRFRSDVLDSDDDLSKSVVLFDERVRNLYSDKLGQGLREARTVLISAREESKSLEEMPQLVERLVAAGVRKDDELLAIGGGVTQDIAAFLSTIMFRGMSWSYIPTTLLAQSDSCIGSKSSINAAGTKNLVGTFRAPRVVTIDTAFLGTLDDADIRSGIGEMLKVHAIDGPIQFDELASEYSSLVTNAQLMTAAIRRSLLMKRKLIEIDEFDRGARNVMNYGHSFGHAIEIAADYGIPHGIAVSIGMDMANFVAASLGISSKAQFDRMHEVLSENYAGVSSVPIPEAELLEALKRDKKNTATHLRLVLPDQSGRIGIVPLLPDEHFTHAVREYLATGRG